MDGMRMRTIAGLLVLGLALWGPGMPLALAQLDYATIEIALARDPDLAVNPALEAICLEVVSECQANPAAERQIEVRAAEIANAGKTVTELPLPDTTTLQTTLTQNAGLNQATAQTLAADTQKVLTDMQVAFAAGDPLKAEQLAKAFQEECRTRYGVDPASVFGAGRETGGLTFDRILGNEDFIKGTLEYSTAYGMGREFAGRGIGVGTGTLPDPEEALKVIGAMNIPPAEKTRMADQYRAYAAFVDKGDFGGIAKMHQEDAQRALKEWRESGGVMPSGTTGMTPDMMARMMAEHSMPIGMEGTAFTPEMVAMMSTMEHTMPMGMEFTPEMAAAMASGGMTTEHYATSGATFETVVSSGGIVEVVAAGPGASYDDNQAGGCDAGSYHDPSTGQCKLLGT